LQAGRRAFVQATPGARHRPLATRSGRTPPAIATLVVAADAAAAREKPTVRDYLVWSRSLYVRVTPDDNGWTVRFIDARYDARYGARAEARAEAGRLAGVGAHISRSEIR
jgi:hypothetical protein